MSLKSNPQTIGIIFAAGRGSRLAPLTNFTPKPLMKIFEEKTLLEINLQKIEPLVSEFVIVTGWLGEQIVDKIGNEFLGKKVTFVKQENPAGGTFEALKTAIYSWSENNLDSSLDLNTTSFLITNGDNICGTDFYQILGKQIQTNPNQACLLAKKIENREFLKSLGVFVVNQNQEFVKVVEKSKEFISDLTNVGIYYFPSKILEFLPKKPLKNTSNHAKSLNLSNQKEELITDLFNLYNQKYPIKIEVSEDEFWSVSSQEDLNKVRENFRKK